MRQTVLALVLTFAAASTASAGENVMLVLDASGSMWGQIGGRSKVEIARDAVGRLVSDWQAEDQLGLVAYGHRRKGDCGDIETLIPYGPLDRAAYTARVNGLNALGMTPLSAAVIHAAEALKLSEQKATVILVSDGEETCNMDPCKVGAELDKRGVDFTAHVIGFDVPNPAHQAQLRCLAENTGGRYFNARDAGELAGALSTLAKVSTEAALPPAPATVKAPASAPATSAIDVAWTGPVDDGDYVAVVQPMGNSATEYDYFWTVRERPTDRLDLPATAGAYEIRYVSPRRTPSVLARQAITVTDIEASIEGPATAMAGTVIQVTARGPVDARHWIGFAPKGSPAGTYRDYERPTGPTSVVELSTPAEPGDYELRYVLNESERVLVARPITITAAEAAIDAPTRIEAGSDVTVKARGPNEPAHWIGFAPAGSPAGSYLDYGRPTGETTELVLGAPAKPGRYEIRYVLNESERVAASLAVEVVDPPASLDAPASVRAGQTITVRATGPAAGRHWIGFAPAGSEAGSYRDYQRPTGPTSEITLTAPDEPGAYEIRYVLNESERVLVSRPIQVLPAE
jgi:Ca-activated chloride channel family protein